MIAAAVTPICLSYFVGPILLLIGIVLAGILILWFLVVERPGFESSFRGEVSRYQQQYQVYLQEIENYKTYFSLIKQHTEHEAKLVAECRDYFFRNTVYLEKCYDYADAIKDRKARVAALEKWVEAGFTEFKIKRDFFSQDKSDFAVAAEFRQHLMTIPNIDDWGLLRESKSPDVQMIIGDGRGFPNAIREPEDPRKVQMPVNPSLRSLYYQHHPGARVGIAGVYKSRLIERPKT